MTVYHYSFKKCRYGSKSAVTTDKTKHNQPSSDLPLDRAFVIQFGSETAPAQNLFDGRVEHINSGQVVHFQSLPELLAFVKQVLTKANSKADNDT